MAKKVLVLLGHGFEETEYVAVRDSLIRNGLDVDSVSLEETTEMRTNNNLFIKADILFKELNLNNYDALFIPGGPGTQKLGEKSEFDVILSYFVEQNKVISAICAAPTLLAERGLLKGRKALCYPDDDYINLMIRNGVDFQYDADYVSDGNFFTGKNMQVSISYGYALSSFILDK